MRNLRAARAGGRALRQPPRRRSCEIAGRSFPLYRSVPGRCPGPVDLAIVTVPGRRRPWRWWSSARAKGVRRDPADSRGLQRDHRRPERRRSGSWRRAARPASAWWGPTAWGWCTPETASTAGINTFFIPEEKFQRGPVARAQRGHPEPERRHGHHGDLQPAQRHLPQGDRELRQPARRGPRGPGAVLRRRSDGGRDRPVHRGLPPGRGADVLRGDLPLPQADHRVQGRADRGRPAGDAVAHREHRRGVRGRQGGHETGGADRGRLHDRPRGLREDLRPAERLPGDRKAGGGDRQRRLREDLRRRQPRRAGAGGARRPDDGTASRRPSPPTCEPEPAP